MTTRIYRASPGRWVAVTRHPSGGVVRETYMTGRAALIALDGRNRERREPQGDTIAQMREQLDRMLAEAADELYRLGWPRECVDWILG